ncbi:hypothetical protein ACFVMC_32945 [Nocardia sp. NPDC127579]|uniref:hypothetical protein n=1 Tax=Nocardia sp. NPDC127579 TaxID=3345402 RepID=UPI00362E4C26
MFRRKPTHARIAPRRPDDDPLLTAALPERVATAQARLAHQYNPALHEALSESELAADRELAERLRSHDRSEQLAEIQTIEATAAEVRRTHTEIVRSEARDLALAQRALAQQRRAGSPHAQLARLYTIDKWGGRALAGVVLGAMAFSAANVQHNLAPGGPSEPLFWLSYLLEALISVVLVVFMVSGAAVARWKVDEGKATIQAIELALLAGSVLLNTFPYLRSPQDWGSVAVHSVAPIMMGVALFGHTAIANRMGAAIAKASAELPPVDDSAERLEALLSRASTPAHTRVETGKDAVNTDAIDANLRVDDAALADFEREFAGAEPRAEQAGVLSSIAREAIERAPIARGEAEVSRAEVAAARAVSELPELARETTVAREPDRRDKASLEEEEAEASRASRVAHNPAELETDCDSLTDREAESDTPEPAAPLDTTAVVTLVRAPETARAPRGIAATAPRSSHTSSARGTVVDGALARATDRARRATAAPNSSTASGPFAREMTPAAAMRLARAVSERGKSKQPIEVLATIFRARSQGMTPNAIGDQVHLPHSTVGRAIDAALAVSGPRAID